MRSHAPTKPFFTRALMWVKGYGRDHMDVWEDRRMSVTEESPMEALVRLRLRLRSGEAKWLREVARMTTGEVAAEVGVPRYSIWRWENRYHVPTGAAAYRYGNLLDRLADVLDRTGIRRPTRAT